MSDVVSKININDTDIPISGDKFDGEWVNIESRPIVFTSTAKGTYTVDISSYLPNDDYTYEVLVVLKAYCTSDTATRVYLGSDIIPANSTNYAYSPYVIAGVEKYYNAICVKIPTKEKTLQYIIQNGAAADTYSSLIGYRRIGTNE